MKSVKDILDEHEKRKSLRAGFESMWQQLLELYLPRRTSMYAKDSQGRDRAKRIYDSTPGVALLRLAAVLNSMLTNEQLNWFQLETDDEELNEQPEVKRWLEHDAGILRKSFANSNFYAQAHEMYIDLAGLGTGVVFIEESNRAERDFFFSARHLRECYISHSDQEVIEHVNLARSMTARQIVDRWKFKRKTGRIPEQVIKAYERDPETPFDIIQSIFPNEDFDPKAIDPLKFAFQCVWIFVEGKSEIDRGGYHEFPLIVVPWAKAAGEDYGRGPGWDALADTKTLYEMRKTSLRVAQKIADPPLQVPKKGFVGSIKLTPGGLNYYDQTSKARIEPIAIGANFNISLEMIQDMRERIQDHFFVNQLQLIDAREMTAEEVRARVAENARILGPTFGRLNSEYLEPLIGRSLGILRRGGKLAAIPAAVIQAAKRTGTQLRVRFVSPLAKAQVASEVQGITHTAGTAIAWAKETQDPEVLDNLDLDAGIRKIAELDGAPPDFLRDPKKVAAVRQRRAAMQAALARLEAAREAAGTAKDAASAGLDLQAMEEGRA
jgi:hypothetical protein